MKLFFLVFSLFLLLLQASWAPAYKDNRHQDINDLAVQNLALGLQGLDLNAHLNGRSPCGSTRPSMAKR